MKTKIPEELIKLIDPESGRCWEIPRKRVTSIFAEVYERWVANVIVPEDVVHTLVRPSFLDPIPTEAGYILSLCAIFMKHAAPEWAPLTIGPASRNCALRVACLDKRNNSQAVWVDHRFSDSILVEALAKLGFPEVHAHLQVNIAEIGTGTGNILMKTRDNTLELNVREIGEDTPGKAFATTQAFEDYFCAGIRSYGPGTRPNTVTQVDLHKRSDNHFEAMSNFAGYLRTPLGKWPIDSLYRTQNGLYEWRYEGDVLI